MHTPTSVPAGAGTAGAGDLRRGIVRRMVQLLVQQVITAALLLGAAGSWRWWRGWLYIALTLVLLVASAVYLLPRNPEIIAERGRRHEGTRGFDKVVIAVYSAAVAALFVVAGLDARFGWAPIGPAWAIPGAAMIVLGMVPVAAAMAVNRNLEQTVRIQSDRGHQVATTGPYRFVRHPMYAGMLVEYPGMPLLLGSGWALVPAAACVIALIVRTVLEDRTLRRDLPGYAEYAARTRWRLVPGVW